MKKLWKKLIAWIKSKLGDELSDREDDLDKEEKKPEEPVEPVEPTKPTDLIRFEAWDAPKANPAPASQEMRVDFENGYIQFWMMHRRDHWGKPGTGWGTLAVDGRTNNKYAVNTHLRKGRAIADGMTGVDADIEIPAGDYDWRKWTTENGKTMFCYGGIDLFGLQVVMRYAADLGLEGVLKAESKDVIGRDK